jgi:beta-aspartyl-peptidase (threonine type)
MLAGKGAEEFAKIQKLQLVHPKYFYTADRWKSLHKILQDEKNLKTTKNYKINDKNYIAFKNNYVFGKYGTVGAVALDKYGNLAAGTSTGGMTNKRYGRIGDAPIIGAGTYANNSTCAISCTGWGEYFIRLVMAKSVSDLMEYKNLSLDKAANTMIHEKLQKMGADGGLIGIDKSGNITMQFNSEGMYRGFIKSTGEKYIAIYKE